MKIMDIYSGMHLNLNFPDHEIYVKIPYSDIVESNSGNRWIDGVRTHSNSEVALILVDVHESLFNMKNVDQAELDRFIIRLNAFLRKLHSLGIKIVHYYTPWEGNSPLSKLEKFSSDINILSIRDEEDLKNKIKDIK